MSTALKPQPNRRIYIDALKRMTPEQRLAKAFELSDMTHEALRVALRARYPQAGQEELDVIYLESLERCRKRNC